MTSPSEIGPDSVIVVGRLDLDPPLRLNEQQIRLGTIDPFGVGDEMRDRGWLWLGRSAETATEKGDFVHNPKLGQLCAGGQLVGAALENSSSSRALHLF